MLKPVQSWANQDGWSLYKASPAHSLCTFLRYLLLRNTYHSLTPSHAVSCLFSISNGNIGSRRAKTLLFTVDCSTGNGAWKAVGAPYIFD